MITRRSAFAALAVVFLAPIALTATAYAQAGGLPSTTAPSNSEGTPSSSTGVIGTTRVGPATTPMATTTTTTHHRRRHHHRRHHVTTTAPAATAQ